jgi:ribosome-binding protein aMBF1 (putative translation factor)
MGAAWNLVHLYVNFLASEGLSGEVTTVSDVEHYIVKRKKVSPHFAGGFESGYQALEFSVMLREARKRAGVTQEKIAQELGTKKSAISRMENHPEDIRLSTLEKYARALGMRLKVQLTE